MKLGEGISLERRPLQNRYFTAINFFSARTVADRQKLANYHNKQCWQAFLGFQHRWP